MKSLTYLLESTTNTCILKINIRIYLDVYYESEFYKKDVEQLLRTDKYPLKSESYEVKAGNILRVKFTRKYRFESTIPFDLLHKTCRLEVVLIVSIGW